MVTYAPQRHSGLVDQAVPQRPYAPEYHNQGFALEQQLYQPPPLLPPPPPPQFTTHQHFAQAVAPTVHQIPPYATQQCPLQGHPSQIAQPQRSSIPLGYVYPPPDRFAEPDVRPSGDSRRSSDRSSHTHRSGKSHHERKKRYTDSRPTIGDSVILVWDTIKKSVSGK